MEITSIESIIALGLRYSWIGNIITLLLIVYKLLDIAIIFWCYKIYKLVSEKYVTKGRYGMTPIRQTKKGRIK